MLTLRLLADDLTGALDSAAEFVPLVGDLPVFWQGSLPVALPNSAAIDSGTREASATEAACVIADLSDHLRSADIAFKKIDSLLRGPTLAEIAATFARGHWRSGILAPAFPFQGRITRTARQFAIIDGAETPVSEDLVAALQHIGVPAGLGALDQPLRPGINIFDAASDADLAAVVRIGLRHEPPVLWIGTGGLARALKQDLATLAPTAPPSTPPSTPLPRPILGLFGSDHPTMARQLAACAQHWSVIDHDPTGAPRLQLSHANPTLISFRIPKEAARTTAASHIAAAIGHISATIERPGAVIVAGGETLRSVCTAVDAGYLDVIGALMPGVPRSIIRGGRWDGVTVISKSGAFGRPDLLRQLPIFGDLPS
jgi:D-threonate/D-erythronate kinase